MKKNNYKKLLLSALILSVIITSASSCSNKPNSEIQPIPPQSSQISESQAAVDCKIPVGSSVTLDELTELDNSQLIYFLSNTEASKITDLFQNTEGARKFYSDTERIKFLFDETAQRCSQFTPDDDLGLQTLMDVLRNGFYLAYYNSFDYLDMCSDEIKSCAAPVYEALLENENFRFGTTAQNNIINTAGMMIGNTSCPSEILNKFAPVIRNFTENRRAYFVDRNKLNAAESLFSGISYILNTEIYNNFYSPSQELPSYGKTDDLIDEFINIMKLSDEDETDNIKRYIHAASDSLGQIARLYSNQEYMLRFLTDRMNSVEKYSPDFFETVDVIVKSYDAVTADGDKIDYYSLKREGEDRLLPQQYSFEDGKVIIKAGDKVKEEKIKRMYWASKEVESQFFRINGNDKPLEPDNKDKVLTIVIYNSPEEYKMNSVLNNISTDNGGIYIEPSGTFYTYERTPTQSIYTLEELFRHEYTHYLQGKYQVPGMWGQGSFYVDHDAEWFDEATAEFFAGSTRTEGVKPRYGIIGYLSPVPENRFTLDTLFSSDYSSGWDFYNYGCAYITYLYENDIATLQKLNEAFMKNDIEMYRNILNEQKNNTEIEKKYQELMTELISKRRRGEIGTPLVSDAYTAQHTVKDVDEIVSDIQNITGIDDMILTTEKSSDFGIFRLEGTYTGEKAVSPLDDWKAMNTKADELLMKISENGNWSGYDTVTCYFTDYETVDGNYQFRIVFRGLINDMSYFKE